MLIEALARSYISLCKLNSLFLLLAKVFGGQQHKVMRMNWRRCLQTVLYTQWRCVLRCLTPLFLANLLESFSFPGYKVDWQNILDHEMQQVSSLTVAVILLLYLETVRNLNTLIKPRLSWAMCQCSENNKFVNLPAINKITCIISGRWGSWNEEVN